VRSYTYIEVRCADLLPDDEAFAVPCFWTGLFYHDDSLAAAAELGAPFDDAATWNRAMAVAAKDGLDGQVDGHSLREMARRAVAIAVEGLERGAACAGDAVGPVGHLERLATRHELAP
jgi:gamma-glutamylcysteine synthetase